MAARQWVSGGNIAVSAIAISRNINIIGGETNYGSSI